MSKALPVLVTWKIAVRWGNPYTKPPEGRPEVLAAATMQVAKGRGAPRRDTWPDAIQEALRLEIARPGGGYSLCIGIDPEEAWARRRAWSPERKAETRQRELRKRVAREIGPLFAAEVEQIVQAEVARRPEYFQPKAPS